MIERIGRWIPANSSESRYSAAVTLVGAALGPIALTIRLRQSVAGEFATLGTLALVAGILLSIIWALILIVALSRRRPPDS